MVSRAGIPALIVTKDPTGIGVRLSAGAPAACPYRNLIPSDGESEGGGMILERATLAFLATVLLTVGLV